jgi:UDP-N-acetylmuramate dehydrogenase
VKVVAGAGAPLPKLCRYALDQGLAGLNFALSIPGTVGGAVRMNAGAWGERMSDILSAIVILNRHGDIESVPRNRLEFSYRKLNSEDDAIILRAEFLLREGDPTALRKEATELLKKRHSTQPVSAASAGCFFKNPSQGPSAGELLEQAGLKGTQIGNAQISGTHANFFVNKGGATASDVIALARAAQDRVYERFGIQLQREVIVVGEEESSKELL